MANKEMIKRAAALLEREFGSEWQCIAQELGTENLRKRVGKELTSFMAFPERGSGGNSQWRGNCSPEVVSSVLRYILDTKRYYGKDTSQFTLLDPMSGSGTSKAAADRHGISSILYDLNPAPALGKGGWNALKNDVEDSADLIFFHPPYHNIIQYSGNMWGKPHPDDLSRCENYNDFLEKLNLCIRKFYMALRKDGRMAVLVGDIRMQGKFYSIQNDMMRMGDFESFLVKGQFNCVSDSRRYQKPFVYFAEKKAMNIRGLSEATLDQLIQLGALKGYQDLYHLDRYREEIVALEGFGEKSYENLIASINESRSTTFVRFVVAMDIPLIGRTASRILDRHFHGSLRELRLAALDRFDFTCLEGIGDIMSSSLHKWFRNPDHLLLWGSLQKELHFENGLDAEASGEENNMNGTNNNTFAGCTIVATGKLENFTRDGINAKIISLGATPGSSVTKKTDYLICGEKAGSKLAKAQQLGIKILTEQEFLDMIAS